MAGKKPGPSRTPKHRPRGTRGKSGSQFTPRTLARLMRNVDRDVLRQAVQEANIQDLFTPDWEVFAREQFAQLGKRQALLESLAFGTILLKIVRTIMLFLRFLPQARIIIILLAVFTLVDRYATRSELPTAKEIGEFADETGLSSVLRTLQDEIREKLEPLLNGLVFARDLIHDVVGQLHFGVLEARAAMNTAIDQLNSGQEQFAKQTLIVVEDKLRALDNLKANFDNLAEPSLNNILSSIREATTGNQALQEQVDKAAAQLRQLADPIGERVRGLQGETFDTTTGESNG